VEPSTLELPFIPDLELGRESQFHWLDPFHPDMAEEMRLWAHRLVMPYKGNPYRIGYFSDNEVGWWYGALFTFSARFRFQLTVPANPLAVVGWRSKL
jgi:hypothetical protein